MVWYYTDEISQVSTNTEISGRLDAIPLHTSPARIACTHRLHESPARIACTHRLHTTPAHIACTQRLYTTPVHNACTHRLYTTPVHNACTQRLYTSPALWSSYVITLQTVTDMTNFVVGNTYEVACGLPLAYLHLNLAHSKGHVAFDWHIYTWPWPILKVMLSFDWQIYTWPWPILTVMLPFDWHLYIWPWSI